MHTRRTDVYRRASTLVELLVVLTIMSLLLAMLLPVVGKVQQAARTTACAANIRSILQGMHLYAQAYGGAIPGGANTSGAFLLAGPYNNDYCPDISQIWDWQAPIARMLHMRFGQGPSRAERIDRFRQLANYPMFRCPENDVLASPYGTVDWSADGRGLMCVNSYNTASVFHYVRNGGAMGQRTCRPEYLVPPGYAPKLTRIGSPSRKIFIADGARYSNSSVAPDMDLDYKGGYGGAYADVGAWSRYSNSWNRSHAPGNGGASGGTDARIYAFRHGMRSQNGPADAYRLNVGFFDGHVETLGDLQAANPEFWAPRGTVLKADGGEVYPDVLRQYLAGAGGLWQVP